MPEQIILDPNQVSEVEPSLLFNSNTTMMLSSSAVPRTFTASPWSHNDIGTVLRIGEIRIGYGDKETPGAEEMLDEDTNPRVTIQLGHVTDKVLRLKFDQPLNAVGLRQVVERLRNKAPSLQPAKRLSYLMIASLLEGIIIPRLAKD